MTHDREREHRLAIAARLTDELRSRHALDVAIVTGSVAHGDVDEYSDLDLLVYVHGDHVTDDEGMEAEIARAVENGGGFYWGTPHDGFGLFRVEEGVKVDIGFGTTAYVADTIDAVVHAFDPDPVKQLVIRGVRESIPLRGITHVERWRERTKVYPSELVETMISHHIGVPPRRSMRLVVSERGDDALAVELITDVVNRMLSVLFALNRTWHVGKLKSIESACEELHIAPPKFGARIATAFSRPRLEAVDDLAAMVDEVHGLVAKHAPNVDVAHQRRRFELDPTV